MQKREAVRFPKGTADFVRTFCGTFPQIIPNGAFIHTEYLRRLALEAAMVANTPAQ